MIDNWNIQTAVRLASCSESIVALVVHLVSLSFRRVVTGTRDPVLGNAQLLRKARLTHQHTNIPTRHALPMLCNLTAMAAIRLLRAAREGVVPDLHDDGVERPVAWTIRRLLHDIHHRGAFDRLEPQGASTFHSTVTAQAQHRHSTGTVPPAVRTSVSQHSHSTGTAQSPFHPP